MVIVYSLSLTEHCTSLSASTKDANNIVLRFPAVEWYLTLEGFEESVLSHRDVSELIHDVISMASLPWYNTDRILAKDLHPLIL